MHVVCEWIGNSQPIAAKHYLQVTDEHYRQAVQNPVQQSSATSAVAGNGPQEQKTGQAGRGDNTQLQGVAGDSTNRDISMVGATGLEPVTSWV